MNVVHEVYPLPMPIDRIFADLAADGDLAFIDSNQGYGKLGRWSIIGLWPYVRFRGWRDHARINQKRVKGKPLELLRDLLIKYRSEPVPDLPVNGGCIGAISYDLGFDLVDLPMPQRVELDKPLISFDFYDLLIIYDHVRDRLTLQACGQIRPAAEALAWLRQRLDGLAGRLDESAASVPGPAQCGVKEAEPGGSQPAEAAGDGIHGEIYAQPDRLAYMEKIERLREWIGQGEVYIANLTARFDARIDLDSLSLYQRMRQINPAPFAAFIRQGDLEWLSSSPERFLEIRHSSGGLKVETRPIKGTRPRGVTGREDADNRQALRDSGKDQSELLMIVDLERNDLSRVCQPESVHVEELFALETYPTVHHLVASISGLLRSDMTAVDCMAACFPGGSITGAPKMRSMELIERLEEQPRGYYTGSLGYFSADGQADFNILIRTMIRQQEQIRYGAGGGITWESDPAEEYQEILDKMAAFRRVIEMSFGCQAPGGRQTEEEKDE
jgi:para-aminobenzoate synthetase component I